MGSLRKTHYGTRASISGIAALTLVLAGCATGPRYGPDSPVTTIAVPANRLTYIPLVPKLPVTAGIHYTEFFHAASATTGGGDSPRVRHEFGDAAVALFDQHAAAMFDRTVELPPNQMPEDMAAAVDIVFVPRFEPMLAIAFHEHCARTTILSGFKLGVDVLAPDGSSITTLEVSMTTPSISDNRAGDCRQRLSKETDTRLFNEAVGELSIALFLSPEIARWAEARNVAWHWPPESSCSREAALLAGVTIIVCNHHGCSEGEGSLAVGEALRTLDPSVEIIPAEDIQSALYPLLGRRSLTDTEKLPLLLSPAAASRACKAGVRHLIVAEVIDQWKTGHGVGLSPVGVGGGIGVGMQKAYERAHIRVFDFLAIEEAGEIKHQRESISMVGGMVGWLPVIIPVPRIGDEMPVAIAKQLLQLLRVPR